MQVATKATAYARTLSGLRASQASLPRTLAATGGGSAALPPGQDTLVLVFLRGGMDGLSLCVPWGDPDYPGLRPNLAIPSPGSAGGALPLGGIFGLNPNASALMAAYNAGDLAFVQTVGSTDPTQSHFDAQKQIEGGYPNQPIPTGGYSSGWLGRHMQQTTSTANIRGIVLDSTVSLALAGAPQTLPMPDPAEFTLSGYSTSALARRGLLGLLYSRATPLLAGPAASTLAAIDTIGGIDFAGYQPSNGAVYPAQSYFSFRMQRAAALIKAGLGLEALEVDYGGWDDHENLGSNVGPFADRIRDLADTLAAFYTDLGSMMGQVTLVVMSEFGRRVAENGSLGLDHGRGGCMLMLGHNVVGGQVVHDWQGLTPGDLDDGNLQVRLDYRNVVCEVLQKRMGTTNLGQIFPGFTPSFYNLIA